MNQIWGVDLGGTKTEVVVLDADNNFNVILRQRIETKRENGYEYILDKIQELINSVVSTENPYPENIGFGTPGSIDPKTGLLKNSNSTALNNQPLKNDLSSKLGCSISMANDANCFALAEFKMGVVKEKFPDASSTFGVIMGTGVGGGVVVNSIGLNGHQGIAGEWGHNFLDASGGECYCGKSGCVERIISGPSLEHHYFQISGIRKSLREIVESHELKSDVHASATISRLINFFGMGLSVVVNILDPDVIVIGGGVGNVNQLYSEGYESLKKHVFNPYFDTPIVRPSLGDSAGVFGAALLTLNV